MRTRNVKVAGKLGTFPFFLLVTRQPVLTTLIITLDRSFKLIEARRTSPLSTNMVLIDPTAMRNYEQLYASQTYPNFDSKAKLLAFTTEDTSFSNTALVEYIANAANDLRYPEHYLGWVKGKYHLLHRPMMLRSTLGQVEVPEWQNNLYLLEDDILEGGDLPIARKITAQAFTVRGPFKVPKILAWKLANEKTPEAEEYVEDVEVTEDDPDIAYDMVSTRMMQPVPKEFVGPVLAGLNARAMLRLVLEKAEATENGMEKFEHFIDHLRVANLQAGRTALSRQSEFEPLTDRAGRAWVRSNVERDLPERFGTTQGSNESTMAPEILAALTESTKTTQQSMEAISKVVVDALQGKVADKPTPKTIEGAFPTIAQDLLRIAGVTTYTKLQPVWHDLAKADKHGRARVLEQFLYMEAKVLHRGNMKFVVSNHLARNICSLKFNSRGDLDDGLNMFNTVVLASHAKQAAAVEKFNEDDLFMDNGVTSLKDKQTHGKFKHAVMPKTASLFREMVIGYYVFLRVLFGRDHPLTLAYEKLYHMVEELTTTLEHWNEARTYERCLWGIYSRVNAYYDDVVLPDGDIDRKIPDLVRFAESMRHRDPLPRVDWGGAGPPLSSPPNAPPPAGGGGGGGKTDPAEKTKNTDKNPALKADLLTGRVAKFIEDNGTPPLHDNGKELCLIYHAKKAGCKKDCRRITSHKPLSEGEQKKLAEYLSKEQQE